MSCKINSHRAILLVSILFIVQCSFAQKRTDTHSEKNNVKISEIRDGIAQSTFENYYLADSFSKENDTIQAGVYLLKINPYTLFFENVTPDSIDDFVLHHFKVTSFARTKYREYFMEIYKAKKSNSYTDFERMGEEDRYLRGAMENCINDSCARFFADKMKDADSIHAAYLYRYVKSKGWPSLSDGSMYATLIAIHDHDHHRFYLPFLKKALADGQVEPSGYNLISYWDENNNDFQKLNDYIQRGKYIQVDVTCMLDNKPVPALVFHKIKTTVQHHCPVKIFYCYRSHAKDKFTNWSKKEIPRSIDVMSLLAEDLAVYNCHISSVEMIAMQTGCWGVRWEPSDDSASRLIMYILYDRDTSNPIFDKILTENKFVTRVIHYEISKSSIKPESMEFLKQLAIWLKKNTMVKLEIDGHTDSEGDVAANMKLSQDRADEVKKQLVLLGIDSNRLTTKGYGATKPIKSNDTEEGKAENRRVEFIKR